MKHLIKELKENNQDFEFYPTTNEIIEVIKRDLNYERINSILDVGAGNGNFLNKINNNYSLFAIEKSPILLQQLSENISILGTDFETQTLIDKKVDCVFSNPPYSKFEEWTLKIIKEANSRLIYLVIPQRWKDKPEIIETIEKRKGSYSILGSFDFLNSEYREARAKIDIVKISFKYSGYSNKEIEVDPFDLWFDENFKINTDKKETYNYTVKEAKKKKISELVKGQNLIERLEELYQDDFNNLLNNYKALEQLDAGILKELGVNLDGLKSGLKEKIKGLKSLYWHELFDRLNKITERLTSSSRENILLKMKSQVMLDYTASNAYAIVLWVIKNANRYIDKQLVEVYKEMTEAKNVINYKSNKRMLTDTWRYAVREHTRYKLDYRIICERYSCFDEIGYRSYDYPNGLNKKVHDFINDILTVAKTLGFNIFDDTYDFDWSPGETVEISHQLNGELNTFVSVKAYKKGTIHLKFCQEFMKKFNVEAARLNKWVKDVQEASNELNIPLNEVKDFYGSCNLNKIGNNIKKLLS